MFVTQFSQYNTWAMIGIASFVLYYVLVFSCFAFRHLFSPLIHPSKKIVGVIKNTYSLFTNMIAIVFGISTLFFVLSLYLL